MLTRIEILLGALCGLVGSATLVQRDWIEVLFHVDPDGGNGATELAIAVGLLAACGLVFAHVRHRRQARIR